MSNFMNYFSRNTLYLSSAFLAAVAGAAYIDALAHAVKAAETPVAVSVAVAACETNGNAKNAFNIVDMEQPGHRVLYAMKDGALDDAIGPDGKLQGQTILGMTDPRFPTDPQQKMTVDPAARTCKLPGFTYTLK